MVPLPTTAQIADRKKEVSGQVSAQTRTSALGLLAISWALLTAHDPPLSLMVAHVKRLIPVAIAIIGAAVLAFDLLQYVCYTNSATKAFRIAENSESGTASYRESAPLAHWLGGFFYWSKFGLLAVGAALLAWTFHLLLR